MVADRVRLMSEAAMRMTSYIRPQKDLKMTFGILILYRTYFLEPLSKTTIFELTVKSVTSK